MTGKLLYPAVQLRVDVAFHVSFLAHFMSNPTEQQYAYCFNILDYLASHKDLVICYQMNNNYPSNNNVVVAEFAN